MALHSTYNQNKGFTLIEILVVIGIMTFILGFGVVTNLSVFKTDTFQTEEAKIVSLLQKARSRAMSNQYDTNHGICYIAPNYIIFKGNTCTAGDAIPASVAIASNAGTTFPTVVFNRLSGTTTGTTIHITDGVKSADITINNEGTINW